MKMIPTSPTKDTQSNAERKVFDKLRSAFETSQGIRPIAFHSLGLTKHQYKRDAEADFVILSDQGLFVLEVKGGGVSRRNGQWHTNGKNGEHLIRESPFDQAGGAMHALKKRIEDKFPELRSNFCIGYGVVFPDCQFKDDTVEWDTAMLADVKNMRDLEGWLTQLFRYWSKERNQSERILSSNQVKKIAEFIRPDFEMGTSLLSEISDVEERIESLTTDQMRAVDIIEDNPRVLCRGGAGTGKTFLAMELARRYTDADKNVLLVCRSPWLKRFLESLFSMPNLVITTVDSIATASRRSGVDQFDVLMADEGQDLMAMKYFDEMDKYLIGGLAEGRWCIFHDINNQAGFFEAVEPEALEYLQSLSPVNVPLKTNCRNTEIVLERVKSDLSVDMGVTGAGAGPAVRSKTAVSRQETVQFLVHELKFLRDQDVPDAHITILSAAPDENSCWAELPASVRNKISRLDDFSMRNFPPSKVSYCQVSEFKGLENEVIILVDVPLPTENLTAIQRTNLYVGMSRAKACLSIIYSR